MVQKSKVLDLAKGGAFSCNNINMTEEQVKQLNAIYEEAIEKLKGIQMEKQEIVKAYIKELEEAKIRALRTSLGLSNNQL